ncbi:MAG: DUF5447 family protein [Pseudomonas sp.]|nr:DUF5447 family protein [Pseudomonas sp.]
MTLNRYLRRPHPHDCSCSVCWSKTVTAQPASCPSTACSQCRPASVSRDASTGRWSLKPASFCAKHTPADRPQKWWFTVYEPFED